MNCINSEMKTPVRYLLILILIIGACNKKIDDNAISKTSQDSLAMFPLDSWIKFVSVNANDQVALLFKRDTSNTFEYRIELLRKWKALPLDYGLLQLQKIGADSIYVFAGGNSDCRVMITLYNVKGKFEIGQEYVRLERNCKDDSLDIAVDEFQKLRHK